MILNNLANPSKKSLEIFRFFTFEILKIIYICNLAGENSSLAQLVRASDC